jgi:hypothetical protein
VAAFTGITTIANTTNSLTIANLGTAGTTYYRAVIQNGACAAVNGTIRSITVNAHQWIGGASGNWNVASNWCGGIPTTSTNVIVPAATTITIPSNYLAAVNNITITGSLVVSNATLQVKGVIVKTGMLDATTGTFEFNGTTTQNINGSWFENNTLKSLKISNAAGLNLSNALADSLKIIDSLAFGNVNGATLNTGDNIILTSTATSTSRVADITNNGNNSGNSITGNVTIQRYFPARRAWRLLTSPLSGTGSIFSQWQNGGVYQAGKGTLITGANPTIANGLDASSLNNYSLKTGVNLTNITDTKKTNLSGNTGNADNKGYFLFVRGDRNPVNINTGNSNPTTISSVGKLQTGTQTFTATPVADGFTLIGNPYMSPVDLNKVTLNNVIKRFVVFDPYINSVGAYVYLEDLTNSGTFTKTPSSPGGQNKELQSSQAMFVQTTSAGGPASVVFNETSKSGVNNMGMFRPTAQPGGFRVNLLLANANNTTTLADGTYAEFNDYYSPAVDNFDAIKFGNVNEMLSFQRNNLALAVERRPAIDSEDTLYLKLTKTTRRNYRLEFEPIRIEPTLTAFIDDSYTGTRQPVSVFGNSTYDFAVDGNPASAAPNRFRIVFKQTSMLPVKFTSIKGNQSGKNIALEWTVGNEINISKYEIEKSSDGINFIRISTMQAVGANLSSTNYNFLDQEATMGNNFYRVKSIEQTGSSAYSNIVVVRISGKTGSLGVYPNPVKEGIINLQFNNIPQGVYNARLFNSLGQVVFNKSITHGMESSASLMMSTSTIIPGIYQLEVTGTDKTSKFIKVVVE